MSSPDIDEADVAAVAEIVRSGRLALGPQTERLEAGIAAYVGTRHAVAVSSGTAALHLAVRGLGLGQGDEVLVPSFTFAASVNVLLYERVRPVFVDVEPDTYNLDPADVERRISPRTRAIMAVDVFGHPAEWDALTDLAARHHLHLIDDSCEALGASYRGKRLGSFGDVAGFAFYPNKQMTTGEGGVLATDDQDLARLARSLRNQGRGEMGAWLEHERLGFNYRLDEMSAALGVSQLARLDAFLERRDRVAAAYGERLARIERVRAPSARPHVRMSWFVYVVTLEEGLDRDPVMRAIEERGIPVRGYFPPVHLQSYIRELLDTGPGLLPVTEAIARRTIALPFHNRLPEESIDRVVEALAGALL
jgi:perosamine synthetase